MKERVREVLPLKPEALADALAMHLAKRSAHFSIAGRGKTNVRAKLTMTLLDNY